MRDEELRVLAPEFSAQILSLRPDIARFIGARRRRKRVVTPDAEDEVQEALTEIVRSVPNYRAELGEFRPWAFGIALNVHRRFSRNRKHQEDCFSDQDIDADAHEAQDPSPERSLQVREARGHVERANRHMPNAQYAALYLLVVEGHSHAEIGKELGITESASKQLVHRARGYLAKRGLNEETFFSAAPVVVEIEPRNGEGSAFWREMYDWSLRLGHVVALFAALALAGPVKPLALAKAWLSGFVREHVVALDQPPLDPDKPTSIPDDPAPRVETSPKGVPPVVRGPSVKPKFQGKSYDLSLMVRTNP